MLDLSVILGISGMVFGTKCLIIQALVSIILALVVDHN
jgi:hypothetical protein